MCLCVGVFMFNLARCLICIHCLLLNGNWTFMHLAFSSDHVLVLLSEWQVLGPVSFLTEGVLVSNDGSPKPLIFICVVASSKSAHKKTPNPGLQLHSCPWYLCR